MKRFHLSLRFKLTAIVAGVMSVCCLLLTAVSLSHDGGAAPHRAGPGGGRRQRY